MNREKNPKNWVSLDLEMNKNVVTGNVDDIIQIGACIFDFYTGEVIDKIRIYVKLPTDSNNNPQKIHPFIISLTGITDKVLEDKGSSLWIAYCELTEFVERYNCFKDVVCWGGNDAAYLKEQLELKTGYTVATHGKFVFNSNFFNAKKDFQIYCQINEMSLRSGLAKSMSRLGLRFQGRIHDALDDAINNKTIFHFLSQKFKEKKK